MIHCVVCSLATTKRQPELLVWNTLYTDELQRHDLTGLRASQKSQNWSRRSSWWAYNTREETYMWFC